MSFINTKIKLNKVKRHLLFFVLFLSFYYVSYAADINISQDKTVSVGDIFYLDVSVTKNYDPVNSIALRFSYDSSKILYIGSSRENSVTDMWLAPLSVSSNDGYFESGLISRPINEESAQILRIFFKAISVGSTSVEALSGVIYKDDGIPTNVLKNLSGAKLSIIPKIDESLELKEKKEVDEEKNTKDNIEKKSNIFEYINLPKTNNVRIENNLDKSKFNIKVNTPIGSDGFYSSKTLEIESNCNEPISFYKVTDYHTGSLAINETSLYSKIFPIFFNQDGVYIISVACGASNTDIIHIVVPIATTLNRNIGEADIASVTIKHNPFYSILNFDKPYAYKVVAKGLFSEKVMYPSDLSANLLHILPGKLDITVFELNGNQLVKSKTIVYWQLILCLLLLLFIVYKKHGKNN